jgi:hypothetical protein
VVKSRLVRPEDDEADEYDTGEKPEAGAHRPGSTTCCSQAPDSRTFPEAFTPGDEPLPRRYRPA